MGCRKRTGALLAVVAFSPVLFILLATAACARIILSVDEQGETLESSSSFYVDEEERHNNDNNSNIVDDNLDACGSTTQICLMRMVALGMADPEFYPVSSATRSGGNHEYICEAVHLHGLSDTIMKVDNLQKETIEENKYAIADHSWYINYEAEWIKRGKYGGCSIFIPSGESVTTIPANDVVQLLLNSTDTNHDSNHTAADERRRLIVSSLPNHNRRLEYRGTKTFTIVIVNSNSLQYTEDQIYDFCHGDSSIRTQLSACSGGVARITPHPDHPVMYFNTERNVVTYSFWDVFMEMGPKIKESVGLPTNVPISQVADHVFFVLPSNIENQPLITGATGWAPVPGNFLGIREIWLSSIQNNLHEMGHNMGLVHGFEQGTEYGDLTTVMGGSRNVTQICHNGVHFSKLDWYRGKSLNITSVSEQGELIQVAFFNHHSLVPENDPKQAVWVKIAGNKELFLTFNRKMGINAEVMEYPDSLLIVEDRHPDPGTNLLMALPMQGGTNYKLNNFQYGKSLVIEVCDHVQRVFQVSPEYLSVGISTNGGVCPEDKTEAPTAPPTPQPTAVPTRPPTVAPTAPPTPPPTAPPTLPPTAPPTKPLTLIYIDFLYDDKPQESGWTLTSFDTNQVIQQSQPGSVTQPGLISTKIYLPQGRYKFDVTDSGRDGICCSNGQGWIEIYQVIESGGELYVAFSAGRYGQKGTLYFETWDGF